ncbi:MAG: TetR/AcrR family transcriptional regulator [Limnobacter sp.]|nr:TetR/AcrR family transcriptional regulator [Limnobacter sp.]
MPRKPPRRTRERILERALQRFNELGEPNVTASALGDDLGISPGNLYYHFPNKEAIVTALFADFEAGIGRLLDETARVEVRLEDAAPFLRLLFEAIWRHRFVYRDTNDLLSRHRALETGLQAIVARKTEAATLLCRILAESGALKADADELDALATNMVVVATGWLPFEYIGNARRFGDPAFQAESVERGVRQVLALLRPWLDETGRRRLDGSSAPTSRGEPA